jgi:hypothetical protein
MAAQATLIARAGAIAKTALADYTFLGASPFSLDELLAGGIFPPITSRKTSRWTKMKPLLPAAALLGRR